MIHWQWLKGWQHLQLSGTSNHKNLWLYVYKILTFYCWVFHPWGHFWGIWKSDGEMEKGKTQSGEREVGDGVWRRKGRHWEFNLKVYWIMDGWSGGCGGEERWKMPSPHSPLLLLFSKRTFFRLLICLMSPLSSSIDTTRQLLTHTGPHLHAHIIKGM